MQVLKVYYSEPPLGPSIRRRRRKLIELRPQVIEVTDDPNAADIQIFSLCGAQEIENVVKDRFILYLHNSPALLGKGQQQLQEALGRALGVLSWSDYPSALPGPYNFFRLPQGVDPDIFKPDPTVERSYAIGTTGFLGTYFGNTGKINGEPILEAHKAARRQLKTALQIGPDIEGVMETAGFVDDDPVVASHYSKCRYVSGMRWHGGFECPSLEGLLCGCRPICFDLPDERYWWGEHALFVQHDPRTLVEELTTVLSKDPNPVSYAERDYLARKFGWRNIAKTFWGLVMELA